MTRSRVFAAESLIAEAAEVRTNTNGFVSREGEWSLLGEDSGFDDWFLRCRLFARTLPECDPVHAELLSLEPDEPASTRDVDRVLRLLRCAGAPGNTGKTIGSEARGPLQFRGDKGEVVFGDAMEPEAIRLPKRSFEGLLHAGIVATRSTGPVRIAELILKAQSEIELARSESSVEAALDSGLRPNRQPTRRIVDYTDKEPGRQVKNLQSLLRKGGGAGEVARAWRKRWFEFDKSGGTVLCRPDSA